LEPVSRTFGLDRGQPIDRFYIERFLESKAALITGRVLEIGGRDYTDRFGAGVEHSDVLHATPGNPAATIVADLADGNDLPDAAFDCLILTQTLPFIFDLAAAVDGIRRTLRPGGWVLATMPGISQISRYDMDRWGDFWRFTDESARRLFSDGFDSVEVEAHGNVATAVAFLHGLASDELSEEVLAAQDPDYQLLITLAARRAV
jgi:SAM-dependent methyltransferase